MNNRVSRMSMRTIEEFQFNWTSQSTDNSESSMKTFNVTRIDFTSYFLVILYDLTNHMLLSFHR